MACYTIHSLLSFRYEQSNADYYLFTKQTSTTLTAVLVYVDDMVITGDDQQEILKLKKQLSSEFHMKDLGELRFFLGLKIVRTAQGLFVSQRKYVQDLIRDSEQARSKQPKLSMDPHVKLT